MDFVQRPRGAALMAAGDFYANLVEMESNHCEKYIALSVMTARLEVMTTHLQDQAKEGGEVLSILSEVVLEGGN